jgi:hypothetical protein
MIIVIIFSSLVQQSNEGQCRLIIEISRHSDTLLSVELLWMRDRPVADLYPQQNNDTHKRQISIPRAGFEPAISASDQPQTLALDRSAIGIGNNNNNSNNNNNNNTFFELSPLSWCFSLLIQRFEGSYFRNVIYMWSEKYQDNGKILKRVF